jgi:hypothetical protein
VLEQWSVGVMVAATVPLKFGSASSWSLCRAAGLTPPETAG